MKIAFLKKLPKGYEKKFSVEIHFEDGKKRTVRFGKNGAEDFTIHQDKKKRLNYLRRHGRDGKSFSRSTLENWSQKGVDTAGYWARWLLWEKDDLDKAIEFMKKKKKHRSDIRSMNTK